MKFVDTLSLMFSNVQMAWNFGYDYFLQMIWTCTGVFCPCLFVSCFCGIVGDGINEMGGLLLAEGENRYIMFVNEYSFTNDLRRQL